MLPIYERQDRDKRKIELHPKIQAALTDQGPLYLGEDESGNAIKVDDLDPDQQT